VVLYELISRRPLFKGTTDSDTVRRILAGRIPSLRQLRPDCPAALAAVVHRALERSPAARYHKAAHLQSDLEEAARTSGLFPTVTCLRTQLEELFDGSGPTSVSQPERAPTGATRQMPRATPSSPGAFQPLAGPLAMSPTLSPTPPTPLPIKPRMASPPPETLAPTPIPDQQLEHFLRLASARRSRAETVGVPALMSRQQLPDEPMELLDAALLAAEVEADEDTPIGPSLDPELERVLGAQVALPEIDPAELPLPAPRHETLPPEAELPAVVVAPRAISQSEAPPPLAALRRLRRRRRLIAAAVALAAAGAGVLTYVLALS
jgi:hypothetical protein